jgi:uncharacterized membrane protein
MIGCVLLTAFLGLMAIKFIAHRRCAAGWGSWGGGPPWGRRWAGHHHHHHHHPERWGGGPRSMLWAVLAGLDLTPAQDKLVRSEVDRLRGRKGALAEEARSARGDMAAAIGGEEFDEESLAGMFVRQDDLMRELRGDLAGALGRIHAALDPEQRERLAELIAKGPGVMRGGGGPYR